MKLKMLKSMPGVNDGDIYPTEYKAGEVVEVGDELGAVFLNEKAAMLVKPEPAKPEGKNKGNAPENKGGAGNENKDENKDGNENAGKE